MDGRCCHFLHLPITVSAICLDSFITGYTCAGMAGYCCSLCLTAEWTECLIDVCHRSKIPSPSRWRRIFDGASKWKINDGITVQSQFSPPPPPLSLSLFFSSWIQPIPADPSQSQSIQVNPSQSQLIHSTQSIQSIHSIQWIQFPSSTRRVSSDKFQFHLQWQDRSKSTRIGLRCCSDWNRDVNYSSAVIFSNPVQTSRKGN